MNKYSNIKKIFNSLFLTHLLLNITNCLCNIASGYIAGNFLDSIAVSCNSLISPFTSISMGIATIFASASEILCGKYMGVGDKKSINKTFTMSVILAVACGLFFTLITLCFSNVIIQLLGASNEIIAPANIYLKAFCLGTTSYILMPVLVTFLHMENEGKYVTKSVILLTVTYVLTGFILIKVFNLSYFGFGLTTAISQTVTVIYLLLRIYSNKDQIFFDFSDIDKTYIIKLISLGLPSGTAGMMIGIRNIILNKVSYATAGVTGIASMSIMVSSLCIIDAIVTSIIQTTIMISSICVGEKNNEDLKQLFKYFITSIWPIQLCFIILEMILANPISNIFSNDPECIKVATIAIRLYLPSTLLEVISDVLISIYTIYEYKLFANIFNILHSFLIHSLYALTMSNVIGYYSVISGYLFNEIICIFFIISFILIKNKSMRLSIKNIVLEDIYFKDIVKYSTSIQSKDSISDLSVNISNFCLKNNIDSRRANLCGLCIEETVVNIFDHGFTKKDFKHTQVDVFALLENNDITLRIRDNSVPFNPSSRLTVFNPDDPCKNIGIRTISKVSKEMTYQSIFGFNSLIIKL